jgi:hypothetical protein
MDTTPKKTQRKEGEATSTLTTPPPDLPDPCVTCRRLKYEKMQEVNVTKKRRGTTKNSPWDHSCSLYGQQRQGETKGQ